MAITYEVIEFSTVDELIEYQSKSQRSPVSNLPGRVVSSDRAQKAELAYDAASKPSSSDVVNDATKLWNAHGLSTTRSTKQSGVRHPAGSSYSPNTVRPCALNAADAIKSGMSKAAFVDIATRKGSKIGSHYSWKVASKH